MEFEYNRQKDSLIKVMKSKCEKKNMNCICINEKLIIESKPGKDKYTQTPIPVCFKGKIKERDEKTIIEGRFSYGFYLTTLVILASILICARLLWSIYQEQIDNIVLCAIAVLLLIIVCIVVRMKGKSLKNNILQIFNDLDVK